MLREFVRYSFVGGLAFLLDAGILYGLTEFGGVHYLVSAGVSFAAGLVFVYLLNAFWVFQNRRFANRGVEFTIFVVLGVLSLGLNELMMWVLTDVALIYYMISKVITTGFIWFFNYFTRRWVLFTTPRDSGG